jgi:hypothetical protein
VTVNEFLSYLLHHETSQGLAIDLAQAYVRRLQVNQAPAGARAMAHAS